jgi:outer membrane protein assembly factor BamB
VADSRVFATNDEGDLYALDAASGTVLWKKSILPNGSSPEILGNMVFCGGGGTHFIYAFDAASGTEKWLATKSLSSDRPLAIPGAMLGR